MLHEKTTSQGNYLMVKHHSLVLESKEPKEGYEPIEVHNPTTNEDIIKYIKRFASVDGLVKKIEWYDSKDSYSTRFMGIKIHLRDGPEYYQLDLPLNSRPFDTFTKTMENINFSFPVEFDVWHNKRDDNTAFAIKQDGVAIKWKYTKDDMGDCPVPTQNKLGKWNFDPQREWLVEKLVSEIIPKIEALNAFDEPEAEYSGEDTDDLAGLTENRNFGKPDLKQRLIEQDAAKGRSAAVNSRLDSSTGEEIAV